MTIFSSSQEAETIGDHVCFINDEEMNEQLVFFTSLIFLSFA